MHKLLSAGVVSQHFFFVFFFFGGGSGGGSCGKERLLELLLNTHQFYALIEAAIRERYILFC